MSGFEGSGLGGGIALYDGTEVMSMGLVADPMSAAVAVGVVGAGYHDDVGGAWVVGVLVDPVLGRHVLVVEDFAREAGDEVVDGGDAVRLVGLPGQEFGGGFVADSRRAEGVLANKLALG